MPSKAKLSSCFIIPGFGGCTPKSTWGKLGTIIYAILGIPLMLLYLTNLGDIFARCFTSCFIKVCSRRKKSSKKQRTEVYRAHYITKDGKSKTASCKYNNRNMFTDPYRKSKYPKDSELKHFALSCNSSDIDSPRHCSQAGEIQLERIPDEFQQEPDVDSSKLVLTESSVHMSSSNKSLGPLPIIICLFILLTYVLGGAAMFSYLENWSYIEGIYFSFVTLTTIGFGDLVPGQNYKGSINPSQIVYSVYLLLGMAIIAMCFNLIQDMLLTSSKYKELENTNAH